MRTECVRMVADWLADATHGFAPVLAGLPLLSGIPALTSRGAIPIYDETRTAEVARGTMPDVPTCLAVSGTGAAMLRASQMTYPGTPSWSLDLAVRWRLELSKTTDTSLQLAAYESQMIEALDTSLTRLFAAPAGAAFRTTALVQVLGAENIRVETFATPDDALLTGAWLATLRVRSFKPQ